jgi:hypothetical protein
LASPEFRVTGGGGSSVSCSDSESARLPNLCAYANSRGRVLQRPATGDAIGDAISHPRTGCIRVLGRTWLRVAATPGCNVVVPTPEVTVINGLRHDIRLSLTEQDRIMYEVLFVHKINGLKAIQITVYQLRSKQHLGETIPRLSTMTRTGANVPVAPVESAPIMTAKKVIICRDSYVNACMIACIQSSLCLAVCVRDSRTSPSLSSSKLENM